MRFVAVVDMRGRLVGGGARDGGVGGLGLREGEMKMVSFAYLFCTFFLNKPERGNPSLGTKVWAEVGWESTG